MLKEKVADGRYVTVAWLCKVATIAEIETQGRSLNPGRYVGVTERGPDDFIFAERLEELSEELEVLNAEARELEEKIASNVSACSRSARGPEQSVGCAVRTQRLLPKPVPLAQQPRQQILIYANLILGYRLLLFV